MLPGELQAKFGNDPRFQNYQNWQRETGGRWGWWSEEAAKAAQQAGVNMHVDTTGWTSELTPWGENIQKDQSGVERSMTNPAWTQFINNFMAKSGPGTQYNQGGGDPRVVPDNIRAEYEAFHGKPAGGGNSAQAGAVANSLGLDNPYGFDFRDMEDLGPTGRMGYGGQPGPLPGGGIDPMQNSVTSRLQARMQEEAMNQRAQMTRDIIRKLLLQGQTPRGPNQTISPAMIRAAAGSRVAA